jgi:hypothetical protein
MDPYVPYDHSDNTDMIAMSSSDNNDLTSSPPCPNDHHSLHENTANKNDELPSQFGQPTTKSLGIADINLEDLPLLPVGPPLTQEWLHNSTRN